MIGKALLVPALAALLLGAPAVPAQPAGEEPAAPAPVVPQQDTDSGDTGGQVPAPAQPRQTSPSDYRASEEISEDLPVSFPVDI